MDLSDYLARKTCAHIMQNVGGNVGSAFRGGLFKNSEGGIKAWGGYRMRFVDNENCIRIGFGDSNDELAVLEKSLPELKVEHRYSRIVQRVSIEKEGDELFIDLHLRRGENGFRRVTNEEKLFYAVYNVGVRPVLRKIYELKR